MKKLFIIVFLLLSVVPLLSAEENHDLASYFPRDALVFLRAENMTNIIDSYSRSEFNREYFNTAAFSGFSKSKLYRKLGDRFSGWEKLTGLDIHIKNIQQFAGGESALAVYDIGKIDVLFITKVTYAQASKSKLFMLKKSFETLDLNGQTCFMKADKKGEFTFLFGYVDNMLVISTNRAIFEHSFDLVRKRKTDSLASETRFLNAVKGLSGELGLYMDVARLTADNYFKTYWIFKNVGDFKWIDTGGAAVEFKSCGAEETRNYIPFPENKLTLKPVSRNGVAAMIPADADYVSISANATTEELTDDILKSAWGMKALYNSQTPKKNMEILEGLRTDLKNFIEASVPVENAFTVRSALSSNPFETSITNEVRVLFGKPDQTQAEKILGKYGRYVASELEIAPDGAYPVKSETVNGWKVYVLQTPYLYPDKPFIGVKGSVMLFSRDYETWKKSSPAVIPVDAGEAVYFSRFFFARTGKKILELTRTLKDSPGWVGSGNRDFVLKNMGSIYKLLDQINEIKVTDRVINGQLMRKVNYSCK